ncbi:uncharacterized protein [Onthophagus taurus]|uniref:uncharacterized protein n=1 Tax=Onthophagus taurus TaxID=166361 RepID=UPI0039BDBD23
MKKLFILLLITISTTFGLNNRRLRDISIRNSYDSDNLAYLAPYGESNQVYKSSAYNYPKPEVEVQPPKLNRLYLPATDRPFLDYIPPTHPPRLHFEPNLQPLPSENRPKYVGTGNYIFEIQSDEDERSHSVDVENPFFRHTLRFVE